MLNPKYSKGIQELESQGHTAFKVFGGSMTPIIKSGSLLYFEKAENYEVGDIVFCRVHGRIIDAHLITQKCQKRGYLISNNHGHDNGWTEQIYGKVIIAGTKKSEDKD